ncbi:hypothetical protein OIO90_005800 [Microbotryomycetes sp. JL221]|nr:hypothetical protein OIO90_005800 [Microbotryomycetes sp. JL221]
MYSPIASSAQARSAGHASPVLQRAPSVAFVDNPDTGSFSDSQQQDVSDELLEAGWSYQGSDTILAINAAKGKIGCCCYEGASGRLSFLQDQPESSSFDVTRSVLEHVLPHRVLTSIKADVAFLTELETILKSLSRPFETSTTTSASSSSVNEQQVRLDYRPVREFYAGQGHVALSQVEIVEGGIYEPAIDVCSMQDDVTTNTTQKWLSANQGGGFRMQEEQAQRMRRLRLESFLNDLTSSPLTIARQMSSNGIMHNPEEPLSVSAIDWLQLNNVMQINLDALTSLQIFMDESHASMHTAATKEGLSLFAILDNTKSPVGRVLLRQWFLRPPLDVDVITHVIDAMQANLSLVGNAPVRLRSLKTGRGGLQDWTHIWKFLYSSIMIRDAILSLGFRSGVRLLDEYLAIFDAETFSELGERLNNTIDWKESKLRPNSVCVRSGVSPELDELRRQLGGLESLLSRAARDVLTDIPPDLTFINELSIVYFPQLGYLINVPLDDGRVLETDVCAMLQWDFQFVTETFAYFKNEKCRDLDFHLGDIRTFIQGFEIDILQQMTTDLVKYEELFLQVSNLLAGLDCLLGFAEAARLNHWTKPIITEDPMCKGIDFDVQPEDVKPAVVEDGRLSPELSMILVTGANFSGKSIFLKQVALITYMAHLGSFVPADLATIGLTDRILTRVSTRESVTRSASAFAIDLQQISFALRNATRRSLLVIDEFGKGTETEDGAGLFCAVIEHLMRRGSHTPRIIAATHFHNVLSNDLLSRELPIGHAHMEVLIHEDRNADSSSATTSSSGQAFANVTYLYRVAPGPTDSSHALSCAALFGIPTRVLERARFVRDALLRFDIESIIHDHENVAEAQGLDETAALLDQRVRNEVAESEEVARRLVAWDLDAPQWQGDMTSVRAVKEQLRRVLGLPRETDEQVEAESWRADNRSDRQ